ncbi:hypothetical protein RQP46_000899 [Phenoliferia psychrophenolica]
MSKAGQPWSADEYRQLEQAVAKNGEDWAAVKDAVATGRTPEAYSRAYTRGVPGLKKAGKKAGAAGQAQAHKTGAEQGGPAHVTPTPELEEKKEEDEGPAPILAAVKRELEPDSDEDDLVIVEPLQNAQLAPAEVDVKVKTPQVPPPKKAKLDALAPAQNQVVKKDPSASPKKDSPAKPVPDLLESLHKVYEATSGGGAKIKELANQLTVEMASEWSTSKGMRF